MDLDEVMAADAVKEAVRVPDDSKLKTISELANEQIGLEKQIFEQEMVLKGLRDQLAEIKELRLPSAMEAAGVMSIETLDGSRVQIREEVYTSISEKNRDAAFEWLEATDNDGIIKNEVKLPFGKGQDEEAERVSALLSEQGYSFTRSRSVHPQTLKAFVRRQMEDGLPVPVDIFSIHIKRVSAIEPGK